MAKITVSSCAEPEVQKSVDVFSPTEYTTMLIGFLQENADRVADRAVCEIGTGNGVIAMQAAVLGARSVTVSDVEQDALDAVSASFSRLGQGPTEFSCLNGPLWQPHGKRRYDVILANLPHFPTPSLTLPGRLPTWSMGGADGRKMLDPFLEGLTGHLAPGGLAAFTHNRFVGIDQTRTFLEARGMSLQTCCETIVHLSPLKVSALTHGPDGYGPDVFTLGNHVFGRVCLAIASWT
ncbi:methyltransferase [Roseibium suaedae]|uniref:Release factor glutamine methyltransferase n=1 Tax=Roseibium suaedae TaxID=735517 RepID=A0A1M7KLX0_9HYPH|nr:methyltransferase [Roseibium suaedae]SHM66457.1 release factor glutamine methyltransferase [Roseibium suaedae]